MLTVLEFTDGPGCRLVRVFPRSSFRNSNYQVPGSFVFSIETEGDQGATEIPADMGLGFLTTDSCKAVRLPSEPVDQELPPERSPALGTRVRIWHPLELFLYNGYTSHS